MEITQEVVNKILDTMPDADKVMDIITEENGAQQFNMLPFLMSYSNAVQAYLNSNKEGE